MKLVSRSNGEFDAEGQSRITGQPYHCDLLLNYDTLENVH